MLDIQFIRENKDLVKKAAKNKNVEVDVDKLLKLDEQRRAQQQQIDQLRQQRNLLSGTGIKPSAEDIKKGQTMKEEIAKLEKSLNILTQQYMEILNKVPNIPSE